METIPADQMIPGTIYHVIYQQGSKLLSHTGKYIGREGTIDGAYLLFERTPYGSQPFEIPLKSVRRVNTAN